MGTSEPGLLQETEFSWTSPDALASRGHNLDPTLASLGLDSGFPLCDTPFGILPAESVMEECSPDTPSLGQTSEKLPFDIGEAASHISYAKAGLQPYSVGTDETHLSTTGASMEDRVKLSSDTGRPNDTIASLARLNEGLSNQQARVDTCLMQDRTDVAACLRRPQTARDDILQEAIQSTAELTAICMTWMAMVRDGQVDRSTSLAMPVLMTSMASHMLLLILYDGIFLHIHRGLSGLGKMSDFFERAPAMGHVAGLPPLKGLLYVEVLLHVLQHHLGRLENIMGLSSDMRVVVEGTAVSSPSLLDVTRGHDMLRHAAAGEQLHAGKTGPELVVSVKSRRDEILNMLKHAQ
jgi:hypothetical protein